MQIPKLLIIYADLITISLILFIIGDFILTTQWSINPIYDLVFAKTTGPIFTLVHSSSVLLVCIAFFYVWYRQNGFKFKGLTISASAVFPTVFLHEYFMNLGTGGSIFGSTTSGITTNYLEHLAITLVLGIILAPLWAKKIWVLIAVFSFFFSYSGLYLVHATMLGGIPTLYYNDFWSNLFEVSSWLVCSFFWIIFFHRSDSTTIFIEMASPIT